ncbi:MAG: hypothetical protein HC845_03975 [Akkermansiaceae bacterium]|nr:hypothetical protein [Akkermansiaceae bacterium]
MISPFQHRLWVLLFSAATAYAAWKYVPSSKLDRKAFNALAEISGQSSTSVSGNGTHQSPWALGEIRTREKTPLPPDPAIISLGDDPENFFQSSPPAPIDLSVVLENSQRIGLRKAAIAAVMAWEKADPIALVALEKRLNSFDSLILAAPLSRGAVPAVMPPAFRRASLPLAAIQGNSNSLTTVNRISISEIILGGEAAIAGFSILESVGFAQSEFLPLIARWEDRVVFSFPLLVVLQQLNLPVEGVKIHLGESITLGPAGPTLKIDEFGQILLPPETKKLPQVSAQSLIDGDANLFPSPLPEIFILRDDQSAAEPETRLFSENLTLAIRAIATDKNPDSPHVYQRLSQWRELSLLGIPVVLLAIFSTQSFLLRFFGTMLFCAACVGAQWFAFRDASLWFPGLTMAGSATVALIIATLFSFLPKKAPPVLDMTTVKPNQSAGVDALPEIPVMQKELPKAESLRKVPTMPALSTDNPKKNSSPNRP